VNFEPIASIFRGKASANRPDRPQSTPTVSGDEPSVVKKCRQSGLLLLLCLFKTDKSAAMRTKIVFPMVVATTLICASLSYGQEGQVPAAPAAPPPDATLYTTYNIDTAHTSVGLVVCGSLPGSSGCYGGASLGPFGKE
jgi:hypothetical protein